MKRKIFSKLLMVALVIAAVGSFVSCKDYDDDINNLQKQIDAKAALSELTALQSTLEGKISTATAAAQKAAEDAAAKADASLKAALETAIADAKKAGTDAGTQAGTAIAAANKAQETADAAAQAAKDADAAAKKDLADALKTIEETYQTKAEAAAAATEAAKALADVKAIADAAYTKAEAEKLQEQVNDLKADLESQIEEKVAEAIKNVDKATASVAAIWSAVTSVEFLVADGLIDEPADLNFQFGKQLDNVFGNGKELHAYDATDKPETYKAGDDIKAENIYFIRVSPVNAAVDAANLKLMNSLGEDLSKFVDIKAEAYNELLTRSAETGIWKVTITLKEGVDRAELQKATKAVLSRDQKRTISAAVYAIAIGNTEEADATRYAVTSYALKALTNEYTPTTDLQFSVNGVEIGQIYNRWNGNFVIAEDGSMEKDSTFWELAWNTPAIAEKYSFDIPAVKAVKNIAYDAAAKRYIDNYVKDDDDVRNGQAKLQVQPEEQIVIKFDTEDYPFVDRYYVQFDKDNAVESAPSEFESWLSYNATGLFTMKKASERLILTVPADAAEGDIIGFRLYAVNYDGTLVDPDGKAFYVQVGFVPNADESDILTGTYTAREAALENPGAKTIIQNKANAVIIPFDMAAKYPSLYKGTAIADAVADCDQVAVNPTKEQNENFITADGTLVDVYYLKSDELDAKGNAQVATKVGEVKFIALNVQNPENIIDGETVETDPLKIFDPDKHNKVVGYLSFMLKKGDIVPNAVTTDMDGKIEWKTGYNGTFYPQLNAAAWNAAFVSPAGDEVIDLTEYATGLDAYADLSTYKWTLSKIANNTTTEADFVQPTLDLTAQTLEGSRTTDESTDADEGGDATTFDLTATPTMVKYGKSVKITISDYEGVAGLSRTSLYEDPDAGNAHIYQTLTLNFGDIWNYQTYENTLTYDGGAVGAAKNATVNKQTFYVKATLLGDGLNKAWTNADWTDNKVSTAAVKNYPAGEGLKYADIFTKSSNSAYEVFYLGAFSTDKYVSFAEYDFNGDKTIDANDYAYYVKSENGKVNEYIKPTTLPTDANMAAILGAKFAFTAADNAPTLMTTINQTLVIKVVDAFGVSHDLSIPFELIP